MVRISSSFQFVFCSAQFGFAHSVRLLFRSVSARSSVSLFGSLHPVFIRSIELLRFRLVLSSFSCVFPLGARFIYIFSRILYTKCNEIQMYFLSENISFLRIMQIFDINSETNHAAGTVKQTKSNREKETLFRHPASRRRNDRNGGSESGQDTPVDAHVHRGTFPQKKMKE